MSIFSHKESIQSIPIHLTENFKKTSTKCFQTFGHPIKNSINDSHIKNCSFFHWISPFSRHINSRSSPESACFSSVLLWYRFVWKHFPGYAWKFLHQRSNSRLAIYPTFFKRLRPLHHHHQRQKPISLRPLIAQLIAEACTIDIRYV